MSEQPQRQPARLQAKKKTTTYEDPNFSNDSSDDAADVVLKVAESVSEAGESSSDAISADDEVQPSALKKRKKAVSKTKKIKSGKRQRHLSSEDTATTSDEDQVQEETQIQDTLATLALRLVDLDINLDPQEGKHRIYAELLAAQEKTPLNRLFKRFKTWSFCVGKDALPKVKQKRLRLFSEYTSRATQVKYRQRNQAFLIRVILWLKWEGGAYD